MSKLKRSIFKSGDTVLNGKYEVLKVIHSSGMSNVYLVSDNNLNKQWCLKEIRKSEAGKNQLEYRSLLREANIMKSLNHSNIPRITTIEEDGDSIFIVMDYVDGMSIKSWLVRKGKINQKVAINWMKQITQVVMYLHNRKQPIFYRDMKPDNVMIQSDGNIKLLDFGISIVMKENENSIVIKEALGTPGYAAPEQSKKGNKCDLRADIYSMGKTLYYMLTGINPSRIPKGTELKPVRMVDSSISIGLEKIIKKCTEPNPDDRYQTCEELLYALQNIVTLEEDYISSIKRKCVLVTSMFFTSIVLLISSIIPYNLYKNQQKEEYDRLLTVAQQSGREEDYVSVLEINSDDVTPYLGYIESMKVDGVFSKEEENTFLNYVNPNIETLKEHTDYGSLAYNIGKLYWFYYSGENEDEGMITSVRWFKDALDSGYEIELSNVYYQLGSFKRGISAAVAESSDSGMYKDYWNNLIKVKEVDSGELVNLQLNATIANCINSYAYNLKRDGVPYKNIQKEIQDLNTFVSSYSPNIEKASVMFESLKSTLKQLPSRVETVYGENK